MLVNQPPKPRFVPLGPWNPPAPPFPVAPTAGATTISGGGAHAHQRASSYVLVYRNPTLEMNATMMKMIAEIAEARP